MAKKIKKSYFEPTQDLGFDILNLASSLPTSSVDNFATYSKFKKIYRDDDEVFQATNSRMGAATSQSWVIEGGSPEINKIVTLEIERHYDNMAKSFWWSIPYGFSVTHFWYNRDYSIANVLRLPNNKFSIKRDGIARYSVSDDAIDEFSCVTTTHLADFENPQGHPLYRSIMIPAMLRCSSFDFWGKYLQKYVIPFIIAKVGSIPDEASRNRYTKDLMNALSSLKKGGVFIHSDNVEVDTQSTQSRHSEFESITRACDKRIQKVILGQSGTSDSDNVGSFAAAKTFKEVKDELTRADCKLMASSFNKLIRSYVAFRTMHDDSFPAGEAPVFKYIFESDIRDDVVNRDKGLYDMGVRFSKDYIVNRHGFKDDDIYIDGSVEHGGNAEPSMSSQPDFYGEFGSSCQSCNFSSSSETSPMQKRIDESVSDLLDMGFPIKPDDIMAVIQSSKNEKELEESLLEIFDINDSEYTEALTKYLVRSYFEGAANAT